MLGMLGGSLPSMQGGKGGDATSGVSGSSTLSGYVGGGGSSGPIFNFGAGSVTAGGLSVWVYVAGAVVLGVLGYVLLRHKG